MSLNSLFVGLKGKLLELSVDDDYEELVLSDHTKKVNGVIYGYLREVVEGFIVLECFYIDNNNTLSLGNRVYVNTDWIKVFTEVNNKGCLNDVLLSSSHSRKIKEMAKIK